MLVSLLPYSFDISFFVSLMCRDTLFTGMLLATPLCNSTNPTIDHNLLIKHHQKALGQCWPLIVRQNLSPKLSTFLPLTQTSTVTQDHRFCSQSHRRWGSTVSSPKPRRQNNRGKYLLALRIAGLDIRTATIEPCIVRFGHVCCLPERECAVFSIFS